MAKTMTMKYETKRCVMCGGRSMVELDVDKVKRWQAGELVQRVWPEKTSDERELLITGTHPACWDQMMAPEPDDADEDGKNWSGE